MRAVDGRRELPVGEGRKLSSRGRVPATRPVAPTFASFPRTGEPRTIAVNGTIVPGAIIAPSVPDRRRYDAIVVSDLTIRVSMTYETMAAAAAAPFAQSSSKLSGQGERGRLARKARFRIVFTRVRRNASYLECVTNVHSPSPLRTKKY